MPKLYMLTEHSPFMMSFVFITDKDNAVIIDGGEPSDMPYLKEIVGDRKILAWILTHPHHDHIWGFISEVENGGLIENTKKVYYNFPSEEFVLKYEPEIKPCSICDFNRILYKIKDKSVIVNPPYKISADELCIEFLYSGGEKHKEPNFGLEVNESSLVFKVTSDGMRSVLFLGDLGPNGGRDLLRICPDKLKSDIVQMAHHGHSGVTEEVYKKINPEICLWCAPEWLWEEDGIEFFTDAYGTKRQREWMDNMGVKKHYVTKDGTWLIPLEVKDND